MVLQSRFDKHTEPFTSAGRTGDLYDTERVRTFDGIEPGLGMRSTHLAIGWVGNHPSGLSLSADLGYDRSSVEGLMITNANSDSIYLTWLEDAYYGILQARYEYNLPWLGTGNVLVGAHVDAWSLKDSALLSFVGGDEERGTVSDRDRLRVLLRGKEASLSGFFQLKQRISELLIINMGGRLDYKIRRPNTGRPEREPPEQADVAVFSPRAALIFTPVDEFSLKVSYADAFVDSPYWYRYNSLPTYFGAFDLLPEKLRSIQAAPSVRLLDGSLTASLNFSWNDLRDGIYRVPDAVPDSGDAFYNNAGRLQSFTVESEIAFAGPWYRLRANHTWFHVLTVEEYTAFDPNSTRPVVNQGEPDGQVWHIPSHSGNVIVDVNPVRWLAPDSIFSETWLNVRLQHVGSRQSPIQRVSLNRPTLAENILNEEENVLLVGAGLRVQDLYFEGLGVSLYMSNLLGTRWFQGGSTPFPYPQAGRWFLATVELAALP